MCHNEHFWNNVNFLGRPENLDFFQHFVEKTQFLMKIYFLKMTSEIKSQGKFFWRCQCKIQNTELVFQNSFGNIEKLTQIFKLLTWPSLALFQRFLKFQRSSGRKAKQILSSFKNQSIPICIGNLLDQKKLGQTPFTGSRVDTDWLRENNWNTLILKSLMTSLAAIIDFIMECPLSTNSDNLGRSLETFTRLAYSIIYLIFSFKNIYNFQQ